MSLPEIQEIRRWRIEPGDRLILRADVAELTAEQVAGLQERVRAALRIPDDIPVVILARNWDVTVGSG